LGLLADHEPTIRQWAILSLGERDNTEIREGLLRAASDGDRETTEEAFLALAERRDPRVVPLLRRHLEVAPEVGDIAVEAAGEAADPELHAALVALREWWDLDDELLSEAIERCGESARGRWRESDL